MRQSKDDGDDIDQREWEEDKVFGLAIAAGFVIGAAALAVSVYIGLIRIAHP